MVAIVGTVRHWPSRIDESDIAHRESHGLIIVGHRQLATGRKEREIVVRVVAANVLIGPLDPLSIGAYPAP